MNRKILYFFCVFLVLILCSCTFDYGDKESFGDDIPDLVMVNVEYVRVRSADPLARIQAELFERYDRQNVMKLQNIVFEQYGERGEEVFVYGKAGNAVVNIGSGDIIMDMNVNMEVKTEDVMLETRSIEWKDEPRHLFSGENEIVRIYRSNGTRFSGTGLFINARMRAWDIFHNASGVFIHDDD